MGHHHHHQSHHHHHQAHHHQPPPLPQPEYGTFQGVANVIHHHHQPPHHHPHHHHQPPPPQPHRHVPLPPLPVTGFPQPVPPSGHNYYEHSYQAVPGYAVVEGSSVPLHRLPCCGLGFGWFLFIIGFFLGSVPWYIGAIIHLCVRSYDHREKAGYIACTIAAILATIVILFGLSSVADHHHYHN